MITWEQVAYFRALNTGLTGEFDSVEIAASKILGAQAQVEAPARWALALRTQSHPTAAEITQRLLEDRTLIRAWGQRDTVHMYAVDDWHLFAKAQSLWPASARRGPMPTDEELADFVGVIESIEGSFTRSSLLDAAPTRLIEAFREFPQNDDPPDRMAITRLIWVAGREGFLSSTENVGREQGYAARKTWVPNALWPEMTAEAAAREVVRRYLQVWAPARVQDIAHFLGARVSDVRRWVEPIQDELLEIDVEGLKGHLIFRVDFDRLLEPPAEWPARLLPAFDTQMMSHANKEPVLKNSADQPQVWGKSAIVRPTIMFRGQFVATWAHKATKRAVTFEVTPLTGADDKVVESAIAQAVAEDGARFTRHLGVS
jgi:hypothetical protein